MTADPDKVLASKRDKLAELDAANGETFNTIQASVPDFSMDTTGVRTNALIELLKEQGILSEEAWLDFEIAFHEKVKEALEPILARVHVEKKRANLTVVKKGPPGKLLGPDGRTL